MGISHLAYYLYPIVYLCHWLAKGLYDQLASSPAANSDETSSPERWIHTCQQLLEEETHVLS